MALARNRRTQRHIDYWPGFVDALTTLLLAIMFLLTVFVLAQFLLSREVNNKDSVLARLNSQIQELTQLLSLERSNSQDMQDTIANLQASLSTVESERSRLQSLLNEGSGAGAAAEKRAGELAQSLDAEKQVSARALNQVELLNQQIAALRRQIAALAQRVQELNRYRSDFFGRLREILSDKENIRIVGDRFVFQSEVLFPTGSAEINPKGQVEMKKLADAIIQLNREIPDDINWVLRVDGHTDNVPLAGTGRFRDNWELSSARATAVVKFLIANGVPANRLVAAGFGEYQPLDTANTADARARNRRIELKLTER
ncbi:hypothetical protein H721_01666 [Brucella ovis IntaBari-2006-46-332]|uniref:OmpA/MotB domain n=1 Tax=Brucella ovis (strain ATCC 25840 / 63/290 / NCTC 10512) TaxID=444178 RepID=A0A0H3APJ0_BRUO2|nr:peptidoglycan-binding protein [Brucella ovis]ABQ60860.1 OmpA/MotB domain [Brucella ovis ATCC 25840]ENR03272.1 hypothetical protein C010_01658 [Brucella ovis 80/125]ENR07744.1 hypothetical protein C961_01638 [Brucella ovis F8/05B]ENS94169.1 hypothetical protein B999_01980 [Brucella ovis 63/96]ENS98268.1 hypothetical protein C009_01668 [Brucella ovis 81/8]